MRRIGEYELDREIGQRWAVMSTWRGKSAGGELVYGATCPTVVATENGERTVNLAPYLAPLAETELEGLVPYRVVEIEGAAAVVRQWFRERLVERRAGRAELASILGELAQKLERAPSLPQLSLHADNVFAGESVGLADWGMEALARAMHAPTGAPVKSGGPFWISPGLHTVPAGPPGPALARALAFTYAQARIGRMPVRDDNYGAWVQGYVKWCQGEDVVPWDLSAIEDAEERAMLEAALRKKEPGSAAELFDALRALD